MWPNLARLIDILAAIPNIKISAVTSIISELFSLLGDLLEYIRNNTVLEVNHEELVKGAEHLLRSIGYVLQHGFDGADELILGIAELLESVSSNITNKKIKRELEKIVDKMVDSVVEYRKGQ